MRPLKEKLLIKDATINKVQYDKEWFFNLEDMIYYLKEDLSEVEFVRLPMLIDGELEVVKCCSFEDIMRARKEFKEKEEKLISSFVLSITQFSFFFNDVTNFSIFNFTF
jgi:hypothetical protein